MSAATTPALSVASLTTEIRTRGNWHEAVRGVSFDVHLGETVALVGESGCGKSLTALSAMALLPAGVGRVAAGSIALDGETISGRSDAEMEKIRATASAWCSRNR